MKKLLFLSFICMLAISTKAEKHLLKDLNKTAVNIIDGSGYQPGDTLLIPQGTVAGLRISQLKGTAQRPIVITNYLGQVQISETTADGIKLIDCKYVRITGTGKAGIAYGFYIVEAGLNTHGNGILLTDLSSNIEVDHCRIRKTGFTGIMAKTDPACDKPETWRRHGFVMRQIQIHHNYIHDTQGEGMYIGYTGGYQVETKLSCNGSMAFGHWLEDVYIYNNKLEQIGWDGIQVNLARKNCHIRDNEIYAYGTAQKAFHNFGMSIGAGTYQIYNNTLVQYANMPSSSSAMQLISVDAGTNVFNNIISKTGGHAMLIHSRHKYSSTSAFVVAHNTIVNTGLSAIFYNSSITVSDNADEIGDLQLSTPFICKNNLIANVGASYQLGNTWKGEDENYIDFNSRTVSEAFKPNYLLGNIFSTNVFNLGLVDPNARNYAIKDTSSPAYNQGVDVSAYNMPFAQLGAQRPYGAKPDVGAYEYIPSDRIIVHGYLTTNLGKAMEGVSINGLPSPTKTNALGMFTCLVSPGWTGTISPAYENYTFYPPSQHVLQATDSPAAFFFAGQLDESAITGSEQANSMRVHAYPNPSTDGRFTLQLEQAGQYHYSLCQPNGQILQTGVFTGRTAELTLKQTGMFLLSVYKSGQLVASKRIVVGEL